MWVLLNALAFADDEPPEPPAEPPPAEDPEPAEEPEREDPLVVTVDLPDDEIKTVRVAKGAPYGIGVGINLGLPTGLSAAWRKEARWHVSGAAAWNISARAFEVHANYNRTLVQIVDDNAPNMTFPLTAGIGGTFQTRTSVGNATPIAGIRFPIALMVMPEDFPVDGFVELAPVLELYPGSRFAMDAAVGARVYFQ